MNGHIHTVLVYHYAVTSLALYELYLQSQQYVHTEITQFIILWGYGLAVSISNARALWFSWLCLIIASVGNQSKLCIMVSRPPYFFKNVNSELIASFLVTYVFVIFVYNVTSMVFYNVHNVSSKKLHLNNLKSIKTRKNNKEH